MYQALGTKKNGCTRIIHIGKHNGDRTITAADSVRPFNRFERRYVASILLFGRILASQQTHAVSTNPTLLIRVRRCGGTSLSPSRNIKLRFAVPRSRSGESGAQYLCQFPTSKKIVTSRY